MTLPDLQRSIELPEVLASVDQRLGYAKWYSREGFFLVSPFTDRASLSAVSKRALAAVTREPNNIAWTQKLNPREDVFGLGLKVLKRADSELQKRGLDQLVMEELDYIEGHLNTHGGADNKRSEIVRLSQRVSLMRTADKVVSPNLIVVIPVSMRPQDGDTRELELAHIFNLGFYSDFKPRLPGTYNPFPVNPLFVVGDEGYRRVAGVKMQGTDYPLTRFDRMEIVRLP